MLDLMFIRTCQSWCQETDQNVDGGGGGDVAGIMLIASQGIKEQSKEIFSTKQGHSWKWFNT